MNINIREILGNQSAPNDTAFFLPVYGIGDKLRYFSYLHLFEIFNNCPVRVLISSDFDRSLLSCFPELSSKIIQITPETFSSLFSNERLNTNSVSLTPGPGLIFATWHYHYLNSLGARWENIKLNHVTHDLFVKHSLNVPAVFTPAKLMLPSADPQLKSLNRILLAPFSVSTAPTPHVVWLAIAKRLTEAGFKIVCNSALGGRRPMYEQNYSELFESYDTLDSPMSELINQLTNFAGVVSTRTGLSDLLSLSTLPSVTLTPDTINPFWEIPNHGGRHREIRIYPNAVIESITENVIQFFTRESESINI